MPHIVRGSQIILAILACALLLILPNPGHPDISEKAEEAAKPESRGALSVVPMFGYTPETRLLGGVTGIYIFRNAEKSRPSNIPLSFLYTQNRQYSLTATPDFCFGGGEYRLQSMGIGFSRFPDLFYGIGNNTPNDSEESFTGKAICLGANLQKRIFGDLNIGVQYGFEKGEIIEVEEGGLLAKGDIPGSEGERISGIGILVSRDSRDNCFSAQRGGLYQIMSMIYRDGLGSEYEFTQHKLDLRQYIPVSISHTLAFQVIFNLTTGNPPFQNLSLLGGQSMMRGYYAGRYRDKNMLTFQMEYRVIPVWWRFGFAGFLGFGDVADSMEDFRPGDLKYSAGFGLRFQIDPEERINLRIDFAVGENSSGFYVNIMEAF
jgi:hypothetical protein